MVRQETAVRRYFTGWRAWKHTIPWGILWSAVFYNSEEWSNCHNRQSGAYDWALSSFLTAGHPTHPHACGLRRFINAAHCLCFKNVQALKIVYDPARSTNASTMNNPWKSWWTSRWKHWDGLFSSVLVVLGVFPQCQSGPGLQPCVTGALTGSH